MYKLNNSEDAKRLLQGLGLHIDEAVVRQVVNVLSGKAHQSLYSLYATRPDKPAPVCGKGSVYKIKKLYDEGNLQPYLDYLSLWPTVGEAKIEQIEEAEQKAPKEARVEQKPREEISHEQQAEGKLVAQQLIQKWRTEVASYSPVKLLRGWLDEAFEVALSRFYTNEDTKRLYLEARRPHFETLDAKRLSLPVESDPAFGLLQQKFPTSNVWTALQAWGEQAIPYLRAFYHMLDDPENAAHSTLDKEQVDNGNLSVFITRCKIERSYAVLLTCDLLARGLAALPSNVRWALLGNDLEKLRLSVSLELSSLTRHTPKGGWSSGIKDICALDFLDPLEETRAFLNELVKLQSAEDSLVVALQIENFKQEEEIPGIARRPEHEINPVLTEVPKEARSEQEPYGETPHKQKMWELAKALIGEISLPWIMDSFIVELKPGQLVYADPWGRRQGPSIVIAENGEISVELSIEGRGEISHLHKGLRSHLETGGFPGVLDKISDWRKGGGQYLKQCHDLFAVVMGEIRGSKAKIPNDDVELNKKAGFKLSFPVTICGDAVETASGHPLGLLYEPEALTNNLWLLRYGAFGIYLAQTKKELERYQRMHKKLMAKYASEPAAKDIAELRQKLYNIREQIHRQLQVFEDMECLPGHCKLCSH